jgi:hypothetical protein
MGAFVFLVSVAAAAVPAWLLHKKLYPQTLFATLIFLAAIT